MKKYCAVNVSKNNCHACEHLEYYEREAESFDESGYYCNGREYKTTKAEANHIDKLQSQTYRARAKKCCERIKEKP